jgi:flagellar basal body-associated protein FliL
MVNAGAPPPPQEVKVRTMHSDLESMAKSGGGLPRFENVAITGVTVEQEYASTPDHAANLPQQTVAQPVAPAQPVATPVAAQPSPQTAAPTMATVNSTQPRKDLYPIFIVAIVALLAIGGVGYFAYITFFSGTPAQPSTATSTQNNGQVAVLPPVTTSTAPSTSTQVTNQNPPSNGTLPSSVEMSTAHVSLFTKPADQAITVTFGATGSTAYRKTMSDSLQAINPATTIAEINPKASDGNNINFQGLMTVAGASLLNSQASASFNPDATFFVYRDRNGLWPGYVLSLATGQSSSSAAASVQQLESSASISNLFLSDPGTPSSDGFTDSVAAGVPVRMLPFTGLTIPSYFTYGWYKNHLILSTSKNGFIAATTNL